MRKKRLRSVATSHNLEPALADPQRLSRENEEDEQAWETQRPGRRRSDGRTCEPQQSVSDVKAEAVEVLCGGLSGTYDVKLGTLWIRVATAGEVRNFRKWCTVGTVNISTYTYLLVVP